MKQRNPTTEEMEDLVKIGNEFWKEFAELCRRNISKMPEETENFTITYLQDLTSIWGTI